MIHIYILGMIERNLPCINCLLDIAFNFLYRYRHVASEIAIRHSVKLPKADPIIIVAVVW